MNLLASASTAQAGGGTPRTATDRSKQPYASPMLSFIALGIAVSALAFAIFANRQIRKSGLDAKSSAAIAQANAERAQQHFEEAEAFARRARAIRNAYMN